MEEIDQLFDAKLPAWKFASYETTGMSHDLATFENSKDVKAEIVEHKE